MSFIKIIIICLIIWICSLIGNMKANSFHQRYTELKKFKRALGIFRSKLEFTYAPIGEIFENISKIIYEGESNIFQRFLENQDWNFAVEDQKYLEKEDKEVIKSLGKMLGKLDKEGQLNEIYLTDSFIDKQVEDAYLAKKKNEKLYKILGKCIGIAIAIIFL